MLVVGLNQTIDRTVQLPLLAPGDVLRAVAAAVTPGGKAVNVCRAALTLKAPARLVGPFPGRLGRVAVEMLHAEGLQVIAVPVGGELRGTTVIIESGGRTTVINEPGPELGVAEWHDVLAAVAEAIGDGEVVAISGSVPPGVVEGAHRSLIELVHERRGTVAVDVTSARLIEAAAAGADLVSPNLAEAEQALGVTDTPDSGAEPVDLDHLDCRRDRNSIARRPLGCWSRPELGRRWCRRVVMGWPAGQPASTASCQRQRCPSSTRSAPATPCSAPPWSASRPARRSRPPCATALPSPPPRWPTRSPATPIRRLVSELTAITVADRAAEGVR